MNAPATRPLPDKLSSLIRVGLEDLAKIEANPKFVVDMGVWLDRPANRADGKCGACLAGAVMACSLGVDVQNVDEDFVPCDAFDDYYPRTSHKLRALNYARAGNVVAALRLLGADEQTTWTVADQVELAPVGVDCMNLSGRLGHYYYDPAGFRAALARLADFLESVGQ